MSDRDDGAYAAMPDAPAAMPETIVINGVTYVRQADLVDRQCNVINQCRSIAQRTGLSLRQVIWFVYRGDGDAIMPDGEPMTASKISGRELDDAIGKALKRHAT